MASKHPDIFEDNETIRDFVYDEDTRKNAEILKSSKEICSICKVGTLVPDGDLTQIMVYGRDGPKFAFHQYMRCNFRNKFKVCRASQSLGFSTYQGMRIYDDDALKNETLLVSKQTAFSVDFLVELVGQVDILSETFEAAAKRYNRFHALKFPLDKEHRRMELCKTTLSNAYFLFCYLEIGQRYEIPNYQIIRNGLNTAILEQKGALMEKFRQKWTIDHHCDVPGCRSCIVIDAGKRFFFNSQDIVIICSQFLKF